MIPTSGLAAALQSSTVFRLMAGALPVLVAAGIAVSSRPALQNTSGQKTMANSLPVAIASDQSAVAMNRTAASTGGATAVTYNGLGASGGTASYTVSGSAGTLYMLDVYNSQSSANPCFVELFDSSS